MSKDRFFSGGGQSEIDALENTTTSTIAKGTSGSATIGGTLSMNTIIKSGKVVVASAMLDGIGGIPDRINCYPFIIPNGYRPFTNTNVPVLFRLIGNTNLYMVLCPVMPDGRLKFAYQISESSKSVLDGLMILNGTWISEQ